MGIRPAAVHPGAATLVRPRFAAPTPVQLGPLAPPGELLYAESVTSMLQQLTSQGVDVSCWGIGRSKGIAELWSEVQCGEAELRLDSSGRVCRCRQTHARDGRSSALPPFDHDPQHCGKVPGSYAWEDHAATRA